LTGDECSATGRAALLAVPVGKQRAFLGDAVNVGRAIAHHTQVVSADVRPTDVITHDEKNVGFFPGHDKSSVR